MTTPIDVSKYEVITEGSASVLYPPNQVFYNPVQQYNRDLSSLAIRAFSDIYLQEKAAKKRKHEESGDATESQSSEPYLHILEALSASGLRAIRYAKEIPLVSKVIANDLSKDAVDAINQNIKYNDISSKVKSNIGDAIEVMATSKDQFHVVDLDPYGTAAPFIDSALNSIKDNGLMLVTCTDLGVLAGGGYPEKCFALYGGSPLHGDATHESALRLVLHMISTTAAKYKKWIEPQLCLSIDFYVRLFIRVRTSPIMVKQLASTQMISYKCSGCWSIFNQPLGKWTENPNSTIKHNSKKYGLSKGPPVGPNCPFCGFANHLCGPMWGGSLHNPEFIDKVLDLQEDADESIFKTLPRIKGMLTMAKNELVDSPFHVKTTSISAVLKGPCPSIDTFAAALSNLGYRVSLCHSCPGAVKTDAPYEVVWFVGKLWAKKNGITPEKLNQNTAGYKIMTDDSIGQNINLSELNTEKETDDITWLFKTNKEAQKLKQLRSIKIVRYQENPTSNWGPKARPH
ncbi:hypothetical protein OGAPHI_003710 [Ogataea philodendri]|uniref:tRNA (guanine(26)-N(2))-dimethyltransferase n=1 Tax=Ogataea philodendri TaxID=1378263 RepID=A0A9P8T4R3_9ASCO|nr:uncharacterized protein OGAPHI_003710 [Ogataea philodendri]KAH3665524.1 hypothetical protein OGAPHI_003710 [Ogataea philodendri]